MPELFRAFGIRFFFFSSEHLPIHVHIRNSDGEAKFSIKPSKLIINSGIKNNDLKLAESLIEENEDLIETKWNDYFKSLL